MAQTADTFRKNTIESRLLSAEEIDYALADLPPNQFPDNGEKLARELIKRKLLTPFQAQEIYSGRIKTLVLGNYVVIEKLGQGGMGLVLKARHRLMKRLAAIKILPAAAAKDADAIARFQREFFAAGQLQHANIVTAYDADESRGVHYLAMEFVDGKDLGSYVKATGPMNPLLAMRCILQAAKGLEYAHRQGVIHRDIKPQNLLIDGEGNVKILDMGLARFEALAGAPSTELTSTGAIMGTVDYMAPEQAINTKDADGRSDIYSLGATLWFLLTGRPMYHGDSLMARLLAHRDAPIPKLAEACPGVPRALTSVFEQIVAKTPATRFATMTQVITTLEPLVAGNQGEESGLSVADTLYRDPRLLAFFENLEAEKQTKVFAPPIIVQPDSNDQTVAISGRATDTKKVIGASGASRETTRSSIGKSQSKAPMWTILAACAVATIGVAVVIAINFPWTSPPKDLVKGKLESSSTLSNSPANSPLENKPFTSKPPQDGSGSKPVDTPTANAGQTKELPPSDSIGDAPKPKETPPPAAKTDLIAVTNSKSDFALPSSWKHEGESLVSSPNGGIANLKIAPVTMDRYRVDCEFTLDEQGDAFYIVLPLGTAQLQWGVNAYTRPNIDESRRGFASLGGRDLRNSPGSKPAPRLIVGVRHRVQLEIAVDGDQLRLKEVFDEEPPFHWEGNKSDATIPDTYLWPERNLIGCGAVNSRFRVHRFSVSPLGN